MTFWISVHILCCVKFLSCQKTFVSLKKWLSWYIYLGNVFQKESETASFGILMFTLIDRYVFTPGVDKVKKLFELCEKKNASNEQPEVKEEPAATGNVKVPTVDKKPPES